MVGCQNGLAKNNLPGFGRRERAVTAEVGMMSIRKLKTKT
jgi:hypothetical protein